eukprot:gene495-8009_t
MRKGSFPKNLFTRRNSQNIYKQLLTTIKKHEQYYDNECLILEAANNVLNPKAQELLNSSLGSRISLGFPGEKFERGLQYSDEIEQLGIDLTKKLFKCKYADLRPLTGAQAYTISIMSICEPGDILLSLHESACPHPTHKSEGISGLYGLNIFDIPFDIEENFDVKIEELDSQIKTIFEKFKKLPKMIILGTSMPLFPHNIKEIRKIADKYEIKILYDAAHSSGLIQGGYYQNEMPLDEGAHIMTSSTYKSFGGPNGGMILTNDKELYEKVCNRIYPGLVANFNMARIPSMCVTLLDLIDFGKDYAKQCVGNAQTLALELTNEGFEVFQRKSKKGNQFTQSHILALRSLQRTGLEDSLLLEKSNIIACDIDMPDKATGLRIGVQEMTKRGVKENHMKEIANFLKRVILNQEDPLKVKMDIIEFRKQFKTVHFVNEFNK